MKNQATFVLIILISNTTIFSQENSIYKNHLGINALSLKYVGRDNDYLFFENKLCFLNGVTFKKDYKLFSTRYSLNYNRFKTEVIWIGPDSYSGFHYHSIWSISSGIQKSHSFHKMSLYYGLDLFSNLIIHRTDLSGGLDGNGIHDKDYDDWLGMGIIMGIEYKFLPQISVSIETSYNPQLIVFSTEFHNETKKIQHHYNPINVLSVCYSF